MSGFKFCRICAGQVTSPDGWYADPRLGKFWLCPTHMADAVMLHTDDVGLVYIGAGQRLVLGPYPYEPWSLAPGTVASEEDER